MNGHGEDAVTRSPLRFPIPDGTPPRVCRSCPGVIYWVTTTSGKAMPVDPDGTSHFATCPNAAQHRRPL